MSEETKQSDLVEHLLAADELSIILKSHLFLEQKIDSLIEKRFIKPKFILNLTFNEKISILNSIGIFSDYIFSLLSKFNIIRNKFSHKYQYKLSKDDLSFFEMFAPKDIFIPEKLKKVRKIERLILISCCSGWLEGHLDVLTDLSEKKSALLYKIESEGGLKVKEI